MGDAAVGIVHVAEDDRFRRTRLLTSGGDFAVAHAAILLLRIDLRRVDTLHAVGALLHHAAGADGDVGIAHRFERRRFVVAVVIEVEAAHFVGTVVRAVACPHTAVVGHVVQAFGAVRRRFDRTNRLARRAFAPHARHRLVKDLRIVRLAAEIAIDAQPVPLAPAPPLALAHDGDVVLGLTGHDATVAAGADAGVDDHGPGVRVVGDRWIPRLGILLFRSRRLAHERWIALILLERRGANDSAIAADIAHGDAL